MVRRVLGVLVLDVLWVLKVRSTYSVSTSTRSTPTFSTRRTFSPLSTGGAAPCH
jgi:hypothetical protein